MSRLPPESLYPSHDPSRVTSQGEERVPDLPEDWRRVASVRLREGMQASLCLSAERPTHPHLAGLRCAGIVWSILDSTSSVDEACSLKNWFL